jgi:hypothetical protein
MHQDAGNAIFLTAEKSAIDPDIVHGRGPCVLRRSGVAAASGPRNSAVASTTIHAMNVAMLMRSQTPTPGVGKFA